MGRASRMKKNRVKVDAAVDSTQYWHGGVPLLKVGDTLLPGGGGSFAAQTIRGAGNGAQFTSGMVYFTTDRDLARAYAQSLKVDGGNGALFRVVPHGVPVRDPDYLDPAPAISFMARRANIVAVEEQEVTSMAEEEIGRAFGRYQFWAPNEPYCRPDGTVRPGPSLRAEGWTPDSFALLPKWTRRENLWAEVERLLTNQLTVVLDLAPGIATPRNRQLLSRYLRPEVIATFPR